MVSSNQKPFPDICKYYFKRYTSLDIRISSRISKGTQQIVVIPALNETNITKTLSSLTDCEEPNCEVAVIVVVNSSESASDDVIRQNEACLTEIRAFREKKEKSWLAVHYLHAPRLSDKNAGVGMARKIGMDEALRQFGSIDVNGVIICLDADCTVKPNYFKAIAEHYSNEERSACIYFEHDWGEEPDPILISGIVNYELSLRYFVEGLKFAGFSNAYHTVGSCMTVSAETYALVGGMNKRQAGEDFYFINKLIPIGGFGTITETCVYPSCRTSNRVPFGTGKALMDWKAHKYEEQAGQFLSYDLRTFRDIKLSLPLLPEFYKCIGIKEVNAALAKFPDSIQDFFSTGEFLEKVQELQRETGSAEKFNSKLLLWWSGLRMIKYVHFARDNYYPLTQLTESAKALLKEIGVHTAQTDSIELLKCYRAEEIRLGQHPKQGQPK